VLVIAAIASACQRRYW